MTLAPAILESWAASLADLAIREVEHPIACWGAWHRPLPRTSQRRMLATAVRRRAGGQWREAIFGGNRSGKTELCAVLMFALVLGADHPDVVEWARINGLDLAGWDVGPGRIWASTKSSNASIEFIRPRFAAMVAAYPHRWWNQYGKGEARLDVSVPGYKHVAHIVFKAEDQTRKGYEGGTKIRGIWHDEELADWSILEEMEARAGDLDALLVYSMVPGLRGRTRAYDEIECDPTGKWRVQRVFITDNPYIREDVAAALGGNDEAKRAIRQRGEWARTSGRVWPGFSRETHTFDPVTMRTPGGLLVPTPDGRLPRTGDPRWHRFRGLDWGIRNPTAVGWAWVGGDGFVLLYRCHYVEGTRSGAERTSQGWTTRRHADRIRELEGYVQREGRWVATPETEAIADSWADPAAKQVLHDLRLEHDIGFRNADNDVAYGLEVVSGLLEVQADGLPRLLISTAPDCAIVVREIEGYVYPDEGRAAVNPKEQVVKKDDHAADMLRYLCVGVTRARWI